MIIVEVMGGLGNQMQQYALYRKPVSYTHLTLPTIWHV